MRSVKIIVLLMLATLFAQASGFEKVIDDQGYVITMSADKPLVVGDNVINVRIKHNGSVEEVALTTKAFMPAMPGMPYMEDKSAIQKVEKGEFDVRFDFSMSGTWQIQLFIAPKVGKKVRIKTSVNL